METPSTPETPADRIRALLRARGLTQADLAAVARVSSSAVNQWLAGATVPSLASLRRIANGLRVSLEWLETGRGDWISDARPSDELDRLVGVVDRARLEVLAALLQATPAQLDQARRLFGLPPIQKIVSGVPPLALQISPRPIPPLAQRLESGPIPPQATLVVPVGGDEEEKE